ncbi:MAG: Gfo/Idh/MocA family oxidoreductase [Acidobacteria bacterium]|nr:Gfo/Idh/MocA family oxidoreductase [Acidobacteriota bacterium]MBU1474693.1 Gfo/Idh/MocA family oxidoreductase [Acidobacteriota bacterium]MBU2438255.1 Gfo/Idh/MocA family oxidoreductase [Acidobacteriota bacterium]
MPKQIKSDKVSVNRREFLKMGAAAGLGTAFTGVQKDGLPADRKLGQPRDSRFKVPPIDPVRIGFVGVGGMGSAHVRNLLRIEGAELKAVCDIVPEKVARIQEWAARAGKPKPAGYSRNEKDFIRMCETEDLDLVYTATPWEWHVPVCLAAMANGKHAATEVPAALTVEECWQLVETAENTGTHCVMMENCNYGRTEMTILHMARKGLFGELQHAECGYLHDLRALKFEMRGEGLWRTAHSIYRDGNLYPTHGLGPVMQWMDINRGDRFDYMVSMSCSALGLRQYARENFGGDDSRALQEYKCGDVNVSLIRTVNGRTITVIHDCNTPRPYSRIDMLQGTKGLVLGYPEPKIHIEGLSPAHSWEDLSNYTAAFDHPLWKARGDAARGAGHGGMDYIEDYRLIHCLRTGQPLDMDVYDSAAVSVVSELSERSVAARSKSVDVPDFTRGLWKTNPPLGIVSD